MQHVFNFLNRFAKKNKGNLGIQISLATATIDVMESYAKAKQLVEVKETFKVLTDLNESFPNVPAFKELSMRGEKILQELETSQGHEPQSKKSIRMIKSYITI